MPVLPPTPRLRRIVYAFGGGVNGVYRQDAKIAKDAKDGALQVNGDVKV